MARTLGDLPLSNLLTAQDWLSLGWTKVAIGGTGAVGATTGMAGVALTRTGAGTYTVVMPSCPDMLLVPVIVKSATPTVFDVVVTAIDSVAGTATFKTYNAAGAATDPASGDIIGLITIGRTKGV